MTTPMMLQYENIKKKYTDSILFFRLGDFYEMFGKDAEIAAPILQIALTSRDSGNGSKVAMCGVPHHAVDNYLSKLVKSGWKVAICEQMEDPRSSKGIVKREVVRIVSPGTVTDNMIPERANNYIASVFYENQWGFAFLDISTGEFTIFETLYEDVLFAELERINPAEILLPNEFIKNHKKYWTKYYYTKREKETFLNTYILLDRFPQQENLLKELKTAAKAANSLWEYLQENIPGIDPSHIIEIKSYHLDRWMLLDSWTRRNLELTESIRGEGKRGTLLSILDLTKTAVGGRLLKKWIEQPLINEKEIIRRLDAVEELIEDSFLREDLLKVLSNVYDLERLMSKVSFGIINAKDMLSLSKTLNVLPNVRSLLKNSHTTVLKSYISIFSGIDNLNELLQNTLNPDPPLSLKEGNLIREGFSEEIDNLRSITSGGRVWIAQLENSERERTGIRSLKVGYNKVFGYYIEVTHANAHLIPKEYIRKQTLANAERYITPGLKEYEEKIVTAEEKLIEMEYQLFLKLREYVRENTQKILEIAHALAHIDVFASLAVVAVKNHYVRPVVTDNNKITIIEGRHPVVEKMLDKQSFVPNDTVLTDEKHLAIITGPNMGGKSTYMRQVALIVLMTHIGSFIPAQKAEIGLVDRIFTRIGASDDLASGQSTFMVEMNEVANILKNATNKSLVILDEIGRGTATFDGLSIAWAVAEYFSDCKQLKAKTLFATHYHELTQLEEANNGIFNLHVGVRERGDQIIFLYKILPGRADRSYGIQVARLAGLPQELLIKAKIVLEDLEKTSHLNIEINSESVKNSLSFRQNEVLSLINELEELQLEDMSPRQALEYLYDLKERLTVTDAS